jgi:Zn-dependent membrane protease YugP
MIIIFIIIFVLAISFLPQFWLRKVLKKYHSPADKFPGSGGQFARHLLDKLNLDRVTVEETDQGDHYDPQQLAVRLSPENYTGKTLTAIVVASHEVGHAIQHHSKYRLFSWRQRMAVLASVSERAGVMILMLMPVLGLLSRSPLLTLITGVVAVSLIFMGIVVHLITLPVEWDASFGRAMPILQAGEYLSPEDYPAAKRILRAAAMTYVAAALASLLNFSRWLAILRR